MSTLHELGEFGLIDRLAKIIPISPNVIESIGDDCAVIRVFDRLLLLSTDLMVEGVHFRKDQIAADDLGWKTAASCLSDIAAMGGVPMFCLVSLACPPATEASYIEALYRGMSTLLKRFGAVIVGGDTTGSEQGIVIDMTVIGQTSDNSYVRRGGAQVGDALAVTGHLGLAGATVHALENGFPIVNEIQQRYMRPAPRIREGQWLCACDAVHAALDISDGIVQDAGHLARAAMLGIDLDPDAFAVLPHLADYCEQHGLDPKQVLLSCGEDYELAFAISGDKVEETIQAFHNEFRTVLSVVGRFTDEWTGVRLRGRETDLKGYEHFT
jgi:thiamine-monophosphate kinase